jgi:hypothetical protein
MLIGVTFWQKKLKFRRTSTPQYLIMLSTVDQHCMGIPSFSERYKVVFYDGHESTRVDKGMLRTCDCLSRPITNTLETAIMPATPVHYQTVTWTDVR